MSHPQIAVAGHICLDIVPTFVSRPASVGELFIPGRLTNVGPAILSTGGAVTNTGLALHRLGVPVKLMGKIGNDLFGNAILDILRSHDPGLADGMIVSPHESTSYTIVINPPGIDRIFIHDPGPNDTFSADDVSVNALKDVRIFHFGYPPLMRRMFLDEGAELAKLMQLAKSTGVTTSLDMTVPDPNAEAGSVDWRVLMQRVLPSVDLFVPSFDETLFMLERPLFNQGRTVDLALLRHLSGQLLAMGVAIVLIKLGAQGAYLRITADLSRLQRMGSGAPSNLSDWLGKESYSPAFQVEVKATTGAGDCAIAGLLTAILHGLGAEEALHAAVAVGGFSVEHADSTGGIPVWEEVLLRINRGWQKHPPALEIV